MDNVSCAVVRDLLPLYTEGLLSEESAATVRAHLDHCAECRMMARRMGEEVSVDTPPAQLPKKILAYTRLAQGWYLFCPLVGLLLALNGWTAAWRVFEAVMLLFSAACISSQLFSGNSYGFDAEQYRYHLDAARASKKAWGRFRNAPLLWCLPCVATVVVYEASVWLAR